MLSLGAEPAAAGVARVTGAAAWPGRDRLWSLLEGGHRVEHAREGREKGADAHVEPHVGHLGVVLHCATVDFSHDEC